MSMAALILDIPMLYWRTRQLPERWSSVGMMKSSRIGQLYVQEKLKGIPSDCQVAIITPDTLNLKKCIEHNNYFGFNRDSIHLISMPYCKVFDPHSGDFAGDVPEGSFSAITAFLDTDKAALFMEDGIDSLQISFMENLGATLDPAVVGMFALSGKSMLAEITEWTNEDGPLAIKRKDGGTVLLEREQISDATYATLLNHREYVGGVGTNTYCVNIGKLLSVSGITREQLQTQCGQGYASFTLGLKIDPIRSSRSFRGRNVIYVDTRLSALTHFLDSLFVDVEKTRYHVLNR